METCERFIGVDAHKKYCFINVQDKSGKVLDEVKLDTNKDSLGGYFSQFDRNGAKAVLECTYNWMYVYDVLKESINDVKLANPKQTKAISSAKVKTDKVDADTLAHLLRADLIPEVYVSSEEERSWKDILRYRCTLVGIRTGLKNKIHAFMCRYGYQTPYSDMFGLAGKAHIKTLPWKEPVKNIIERYLAMIEDLNTKINEMDSKIRKEIKETDDMKLLKTIPGVGIITAFLIKSEVGDIRRFHGIKKFTSYCGLVPGIHSSGGKTQFRRSFDRNKYLQWGFVEAAIPATKSSHILLGKYSRIKKRTNNNKKAKMTVARKLAEAAYKVLTKKQPYQEGITIRKSAPC